MKKSLITLAACIFVLCPGCGSMKNMSNTGKDAIIGTGAGAAVGAAVGAIFGSGKGAAIGAAIGAGVGAGAGAVIGNKMDKKAAELEAQLAEAAKVETVKDVNGLEAIKVTFASGILFPTNGTALSDASKTQLQNFATSMKDMTDTDITVYGHTDNTGTAEVNERISAQRANSVADYLKSLGIASNRITTEGKSYNEPVADNGTEAGRAQNRRVEVYITANEAMIKNAEAEAANK